MAQPDAGAAVTQAPDIAHSQLESVHALLQVERLARECDLVLTTCLAELRVGARTEPQLLEAAHRTWPSSGLDFGRLRLALGAGEAAGYLIRTASHETWALTQAGQAEAETAHGWTNDEFARARAEVKRHAEGIVGEITDDQSRLWLGILTTAIEVGIRRTFETFQGSIDVLAGFVVPRTIDSAAIVAAIEARAISPETKEVLRALALEAIDRATPFGNAIVSHVTIGHLIHAFVARRDQLVARALVGTLRDKWILLDTMILMRLLAPPLRSGPLWDAISAARTAGMDVIVPDHTIDELDGVIAASGDSAADVEQALTEGVTPGGIAAFVGDDAIALWLQGRDAGVYTNWQSFRQAASALTGRLARAGVSVRHRYGGPGEIPTSAREALEEELRRPDTEPLRRPRAIERDALTMAIVRDRRGRPRAGTDLWPGAWVVTNDTHLSGAYRRLDANDPIDIAITPAQWIALISTFSDPTELAQLATSASSLLTDDATLAVSTFVTATEAIEIARMLDPESAQFPLERRIERITLDDELMAAPDAGNGAYMSDLAARVSARRAVRAANRRMALVLANQTQRTQSAATLEATKAAHEAELNALATANASALASARSEGETLGRRSMIRLGLALALAGVGVVAGVIAAVSASLGLTWLAAFWLAGFVASANWWRSSRLWATDRGETIYSLLPAAIAGFGSFALAVVVAVILSPPAQP